MKMIQKRPERYPEERNKKISELEQAIGPLVAKKEAEYESAV